MTLAGTQQGVAAPPRRAEGKPKPRRGRDSPCLEQDSLPRRVDSPFSALVQESSVLLRKTQGSPSVSDLLSVMLGSRGVPSLVVMRESSSASTLPPPQAIPPPIKSENEAGEGSPLPFRRFQMDPASRSTGSSAHFPSARRSTEGWPARWGVENEATHTRYGGHTPNPLSLTPRPRFLSGLSSEAQGPPLWIGENSRRSMRTPMAEVCEPLRPGRCLGGRLAAYLS